MESVLSSSWRDPIKGKTREEFINSLKNILHGRVESAYLFGSFAQGKTRANDIDIILIKDTTQNFVERSREFFDLYELACPIDILVYTKQEFENLLSGCAIGFWKSAKESLLRVV